MDDKMDVQSGTLTGGSSAIMTSRMYVGGIPKSLQISNMAASFVSLNGCIREFITNKLVIH